MNREQIAARLNENEDAVFNIDTIEAIEAIVREAVEAERESIAVMIEPKNDKSDWTKYAHHCAMLARIIRARGEKTI